MLEFLNSINPVLLMGFFSTIVFIVIGYQGVKEINRQRRDSKK